MLVCPAQPVSAGIVGIIAAIAAQKPLANLIAGFQIALTQPLREDDVVVVGLLPSAARCE